MTKRGDSMNHSPVFIGGTQRSGTSILRALIDSNSEIYFPSAEMKFFPRFYHRLKEYEPLSQKGNLERFLNDYGGYRKNIEWAGLVDNREFFETLKSASGSWGKVYHTLMKALAALEGKKRWGEKSPGNEYYAAHILKFYREAKIICTIRDPRAVVASSRRRYGKGFLRSTIRWKQAVRKILYDVYRLPPRLFRVVYYEDLVLDLENTMRRVFDFLETEPLHPLGKLQLNKEKWEKGGKTSYKERKPEEEDVVWTYTLTAYKNELSDIENRAIMVLTKRERAAIAYHRKEPKAYNYSNAFELSRLKPADRGLKYRPEISRILNRLTDKPLLMRPTSSTDLGRY